MSYSISKQLILLSVVLFGLASCGKPLPKTAHKDVPATFATPSEAGEALFTAARSRDRDALLAIFGPDEEEVLLTDNPSQDGASLQAFVDAYTRMNRWRTIKAGGQVLFVGADNTAFPVPLGQNASGRWYFDTAAGKDEILARRIGKNELTAITATEATSEAQKQYSKQSHERGGSKYAQQFVSDPGKHNGLYWPAGAGQRTSPLGQFGDFTQAVANSGNGPLLFNGYYYRMLPKPGDFVIVAYPSEYRSSGIMTFLVDSDGSVFQKDLGETTADAALAVTRVSPADGWSPAVPHTGTASRSQ
jgi:hypothetical protein